MGIRNYKLFIIIILVFAIIFSMRLYTEHENSQNIKESSIKYEAKSTIDFMLAFRETYQNIFISNHLSITNESIKFLPVKTTNDLAEKFSQLNDEVIISTISDNPRSIINKANARQLDIISHFNTSEENKVYFKKQPNKTYVYSYPLYVTEACLKCHGKRENAPKYISQKYDKAYDYKLGDLRGIIEVTISQTQLSKDLNVLMDRKLIFVILMTICIIIILYVLFRIVEKKERELEKQNDKYFTLINTTNTGYLTLDDQEKVIDANKEYIRLTGHDSLGDIIGRRVTEWTAQQDLEKHAAKVKKCLEQRFVRNYEINYAHKDGTILPIEINAKVVETSDGLQILSLCRDISERKQAEEEKIKLESQLQQAQKMEAIGLMASGVAHDLNNILSGIIGYPELLLQALPKDSDLKKPIEAIHESGQRAAIVVADLLTVARGAASIRETLNLNALIEEYVNSPEYKHLRVLYPNITCHSQFETIDPAISCSPVHVKKCLMNLVTNAAEAMIDTGIITVSTHNESVDDVTGLKHGIKEGRYVVLSVRDTGPGISDTDLKHIFEPFYTKKTMGRSGTGLGLAIIWNSMEDHNGKVLVESSNKGTCFHLYFPVSNDGESAHGQSRDDKTIVVTNNAEHILVVDDEPQLRDIASQMLQSFGYTVDSVCSGELAIEFVKEVPVDLIVLDMLMEPGISGQQTYEEILKLYPHQKAIVASGFSKSDDVEATLKLGAGAFIKKPYSITKLGQVVHKILHS